MKTILVVDDEPAIVRLVRDYLERAGFEVTTAPNGEVALQRFTRARPDLVILDLSLPEMDGLDVARAMRRVADVPIIMLTGRTDETDRVAGLELGAGAALRVRLRRQCVGGRGSSREAPERALQQPAHARRRRTA